MQKQIPKIATTSISYLGRSVHETLNAHSDVVKAVSEICFGMLDATIKVHVTPRITDAEPLEWYMTIASPAGLKTFTVIQRTPAGNVTFSSK